MIRLYEHAHFEVGSKVDCLNRLSMVDQYLKITRNSNNHRIRQLAVEADSPHLLLLRWRLDWCQFDKFKEKQI